MAEALSIAWALAAALGLLGAALAISLLVDGLRSRRRIQDPPDPE